MNYQSLSTAELIATLDKVGPSPDPELIRCCLARDEEIKPGLLARVARVSEIPPEDNELWLYGGIHAALILLDLCEPAAFEHIEQIFRDENYIDDLDQLMFALPKYGSLAVPFLTRIVNDPTAYNYGRAYAFEALSKIAKHNPSERQHVIDTARALLPRLDEHGELVLTDGANFPDKIENVYNIYNWAVMVLFEMCDAESKALVAKLDQRGLLDQLFLGTGKELLKPFDAVFEPCNEQYDLLGDYEAIFKRAQEEQVLDEFDDEDDFDDDYEDYEYPLEQTPIVRTSPKIGANERCPCGSGKKYKRCCQSKDQDADSIITTPLQMSPSAPTYKKRPMPTRDLVESLAFGPSVVVEAVSTPGAFKERYGLPAYGAAKFAEDPRVLADPKLTGILERHLRDDWTFAKVAAMTTEDIENQICRYGVGYSREAFLAETRQENQYSAWAVAQTWLARGSANCREKDNDFFGIAACELWKRLSPERPSTEMLDDWMQKGYALAEADRKTKACEMWWKVWQHLRGRFTPEMRQENTVETIFSGRQMVSNWSGDFSDQLHNASLNEPRYARIGQQFCEEWLAQFTDESENSLINFHRNYSTFLLLLGDCRGETVLRKIVERWPKSPWGYVALADAYTWNIDNNRNSWPLLPDPAHAKQWLERGLVNARDDHDIIAIKKRLRDICRQSKDIG